MIRSTKVTSQAPDIVASLLSNSSILAASASACRASCIHSKGKQPMKTRPRLCRIYGSITTMNASAWSFGACCSMDTALSWHSKRCAEAATIWMDELLSNDATMSGAWLVTFVARITISKSHQPRSFQRCHHLEIPPPAGNLAFSTLTNRRLTGICSGPGAIRKARKSGFRALETSFFLAKTPVSLSWGGRKGVAGGSIGDFFFST